MSIVNCYKGPIAASPEALAKAGLMVSPPRRDERVEAGLPRIDEVSCESRRGRQVFHHLWQNSDEQKMLLKNQKIIFESVLFMVTHGPIV